MRSIRNLAALVAVAIILVGCGPIYTSTYTYVPPKSASGKSCATQCLTAKTSCNQMCEMKNAACRYEARQQARYDFENYKQDQERHNQPINRSMSDFDQSYRCGGDCGCDSTFNMCYTTCGGNIVENRVCTAFCDKQ